MNMNVRMLSQHLHTKKTRKHLWNGHSFQKTCGSVKLKRFEKCLKRRPVPAKNVPNGAGDLADYIVAVEGRM